MNARTGSAILAGSLGWVLAVAIQAQALAPGAPRRIADASATPSPAPAYTPDRAPLSVPAPSPAGTPTSLPTGAVTTPAAPPSGNPSLVPASPPPAPQASPTAASHAHFHRPGTEVDGDSFMGSLASDVFILRGNVILHSDPKVDRAIGEISESGDPLTVTADEIDIDKGGLSYVAKGHVQFRQGTRSGKADVATLNEGAHTLDLLGNANVLDGDHRVAAAKMHYDLFDKQFRGSGDVRIYEPVPTPNPNASTSPAPKRKRRIPL